MSGKVIFSALMVMIHDSLERHKSAWPFKPTTSYTQECAERALAAAVTVDAQFYYGGLPSWGGYSWSGGSVAPICSGSTGYAAPGYIYRKAPFFVFALVACAILAAMVASSDAQIYYPFAYGYSYPYSAYGGYAYAPYGAYGYYGYPYLLKK
ncbi:hypothetical protein BIW11_02978 [Tropilaelaps mercedesae]|uniref:Uncharacterized protein n=1 Tax=Tropilaelaps mercedesae TaxID=418985 RepID=A0A1V9XTZ1_9ACAR|nr:hypothetical protein BIW11_02978 [Tropilaelaps mercedesae]